MGKKLIFGIALLLMAGGVFAANNNYTVTLTTYDVVGSTENFVLGAYPNISGDVQVRKIILANAGATVQTITFYENASSTSAASEFMTIVLASTGTEVIDFTNKWTGYYEAELSNLAVNKSATGSVVDFTILYK